MNCPNCKSLNTIKYGKAKKQQKHLCKNCSFQFTESIPENELEKLQKRQALILYLNNCTYRLIASLVGSSHVSIQRWAKNWVSVDALRKHHTIQKQTKTEMLKYIQSKQHINKYNFLIIDLETDLSIISL